MTGIFKRYALCFIFFLVPAWLLFGILSYTYPILKCNVSDIPAGWYIAFCRGFGDYEHQAAYYRLSDIGPNITQSSVIFLGDSRLQYAFSRGNTNDFFQERHSLFYINGFGYEGRWRFSDLVLNKYHISPKVLIINIDPFFQEGLNEVEAFAGTHDIQPFIDASFKEIVQKAYIYICGQLVHCTGNYAVISRSPSTGQWHSGVLRDDYMGVGEHPINPPPVVSESEMKAWLEYAVPAAAKLLKNAKDSCVVLTSIPNDFTRPELGRALANKIGALYISPVLPDLKTYDTSHLDAQSANEWSAAFLKELDLVGHQCGAW